jgi:hypothetical protein
MLVYLPTLSIVLWIATLIGQAVLALLVCRSKTDRHPAFRLYTLIYAVGDIGAFIVGGLMAPTAYVLIYMITTIAGNLVTFFVAQEAYAMVFGPPAAVPPRVPFKTKAMIGTAFSLAITVGAVLHAINGGMLTRYLVTVEQVMSIGAWAVFMILLTYSRNLRILWPAQIAGISAGFILYLTVNIAAVLCRAVGSLHVAAIAGQVGQAAYLVTCIWWIGCFLRTAPQKVEITEEQARFMEIRLLQSLETLRRSGVQVETER